MARWWGWTWAAHPPMSSMRRARPKAPLGSDGRRRRFWACGSRPRCCPFTPSPQEEVRWCRSMASAWWWGRFPPGPTLVRPVMATAVLPRSPMPMWCWGGCPARPCRLFLALGGINPSTPRRRGPCCPIWLLRWPVWPQASPQSRLLRGPWRLPSKPWPKPCAASRFNGATISAAPCW